MTDLSQEELLKDLHTRFNRVERAILGDPSVGHRGLVNRVENLERLGESAPEVHGAIDQRRVEGDRRAHDRIDELDTSTRDRLTSIEKKLDRAIWLVTGAFIGGGLIGGGSVWAILGG